MLSPDALNPALNNRHINQQNGSLGLFRLPAEIQEMIFYRCIDSSYTPFQFRRMPLEMKYNEAHPRPLNLLRACKLAYYQYIEVLYGANTIQLGSTDHIRSWLKKIGPYHTQRLRKLAVKDLTPIFRHLLGKDGNLKRLEELALVNEFGEGWCRNLKEYHKHCEYIARILGRREGHAKLSKAYQAPDLTIPSRFSIITADQWWLRKQSIRMITADRQEPGQVSSR